jgi:hypothetical protein
VTSELAAGGLPPPAGCSDASPEPILWGLLVGASRLAAPELNAGQFKSAAKGVEKMFGEGGSAVLKSLEFPFGHTSFKS